MQGAGAGCRVKGLNPRGVLHVDWSDGARGARQSHVPAVMRGPVTHKHPRTHEFSLHSFSLANARSHLSLRTSWRFSISEQLLCKHVKRFRGRLAFKAHRPIYHSMQSARGGGGYVGCPYPSISSVSGPAANAAETPSRYPAAPLTSGRLH